MGTISRMGLCFTHGTISRITITLTINMQLLTLTMSTFYSVPDDFSLQNLRAAKRDLEIIIITFNILDK